jgi:DNA (cytosine-5)-methyltransferase 1
VQIHVVIENFTGLAFQQPENVYGLAQVKSANMIQEIYKSFNEIGYEVTHRELMAADYGVPQKRRRLFFVAAKNLHYFQYPQPTHCETENLLGLPVYRGAGEALAVLPPPEYRDQSAP